MSRIDLGNGDLERRVHVKPAADMLQLDMVQVLTKPHADQDAPVTFPAAAVVRLALLGLLGGILQLTAVSKITVFGVPADLSPLLVASVGFIAGSIPGAVFGFCLGLLIDISLFQTLGVSSLVFTAVGYGAGPRPRAARPRARPRAGRGRRGGHRDRR